MLLLQLSLGTGVRGMLTFAILYRFCWFRWWASPAVSPNIQYFWPIFLNRGRKIEYLRMWTPEFENFTFILNGWSNGWSFWCSCHQCINLLTMQYADKIKHLENYVKSELDKKYRKCNWKFLHALVGPKDI